MFVVSTLNIFTIVGWLFWAFFGACVGSFAAVIIFRLQEGVSIVAPQSYCAHCEKPLRVWHNIPIFSWILLRGKCYFCHHRIGLRSLIIELIFAVAMVALIAHFGFSLAMIERGLFFFILVCLSYIDLDSFSLPLGLLLALLIVGVLSSIIYSFYPSLYVAIDEPAAFLQFMVFKRSVGFLLSDRIVGSILGFLLLALINVVATFIFRKTKRLTTHQWAMGWGDPLLVMGIGLFIGLSHLVLLLFLASALGALIGMVYRLSSPARIEEVDIAEGAIPYGPFLALAAIYIYLT